MMNGLKNKVHKERNSSFEILRLLSMGLVITSHYNLWSFSSNDVSDFNSINGIITHMLTAGCVANIVFILMTGYFTIKSNTNNCKIFGLIAEMYFYSLLFLALEMFVFKNNISLLNLKSSLLPFPFGNWFCVMYIIMYLLTPFLNKLLLSLPKKDFRVFLLIMITLFSVLPTLFNWGPFSNLIVFPLAYSIGAYIRLFTSIPNRCRCVVVLTFAVLAAICSVIVIYVAARVTNNVDLVTKSSHFIMKNNSPIVLCIAISLLQLFRGIKMKSNSLINHLAGSTLGVYLIHENIFMRNHIWKELMPININSGEVQFILLSLAKILFVFLMCLSIDVLRRKVFGGIEKRISAIMYMAVCRASEKIISEKKD